MIVSPDAGEFRVSSPLRENRADDHHQHTSPRSGVAYRSLSLRLIDEIISGAGGGGEERDTTTQTRNIAKDEAGPERRCHEVRYVSSYSFPSLHT